jgi:hypothetical protein
MKRPRGPRYITKRIYVVYENGRMAETLGGRKLIFDSPNVAEEVARVVGGEVVAGKYKGLRIERRGRKKNEKIELIWLEWTLDKSVGKKKSWIARTREHYPEIKTNRALVKQSERVKRSVLYLERTNKHKAPLRKTATPRQSNADELTVG